jgi:hypothetical protein
MLLNRNLISVLLMLFCGSTPVLPSQIGSTQGGIVSGRVVDDQGRPMRGARVQAFSHDEKTTGVDISPSGKPVTSNDRGEFACSG